MSSRESLSGSPIWQLQQLVLGQAIKERASDLFIESSDGVLNISYRVDDRVRSLLTLPDLIQEPLTEALKTKAKAGTKSGIRQGHFWESAGEEKFRFDLLVEENKVRMQITALTDPKSIGDLGLSEQAADSLKSLLKQPSGLILLSGPPRSGRSTAMAAMLLERTQDAKPLLIDRDWHLTLPGVKQFKTEQGLLDQLASAQRQNFEVIGVGGEIAEAEMDKLREVARRRLVMCCVGELSAEQIAKLAPLAVIAMRLVPALCACKFAGEGDGLCHSNGCEHCAFRGVQGRLPLAEILIGGRSATSFAEEARKLAQAGMIEAQIWLDIQIHTALTAKRSAQGGSNYLLDLLALAS